MRLCVVLSLLKNIFHKDIREKLWDIFKLIRELSGNTPEFEFLEAILTYLSSATDQVDEAYLGQLIEDVSLNAGGEIMQTLYNKWVEKGIKQGIEQGSQNTVRESVIELLDVRFGELPPRVLMYLNELTDIPTLKMLLKSVITTPDIVAFQTELEKHIPENLRAAA